MTRRQVSYQWRLREIMTNHGLFGTTHLAPLLAERGIVLSASQIHRLVTGTPERLPLPVLARSVTCSRSPPQSSSSPEPRTPHPGRPPAGRASHPRLGRPSCARLRREQ